MRVQDGSSLLGNFGFLAGLRVLFPLAISTSIWCSTDAICSGLYLFIGMTGPQGILSHFTWYKNPRSGQGLVRRFHV